MSEATWAAVAVAFVNMIGSVALAWLRYYYRVTYHVDDGHVDRKKEKPLYEEGLNEP